MSRFEETLQRDLRQIADRATPSPDAWAQIQSRIDAEEPFQETEIIMLTENTYTRRRWPLVAAAAAVAALAVGAIALVNRGDGEELPADVPTPTVAPTPGPEAEPTSGATIELPPVESQIAPGRYTSDAPGVNVTFSLDEGQTAPWTLRSNQEPGGIQLWSDDTGREFIAIGRVGSWYGADEARDGDMTGLGSIAPDEIDRWIEENGIIVTESASVDVGNRPAQYRQIRLDTTPGASADFCPPGEQPCLWAATGSADTVGEGPGPIPFSRDRLHSIWLVDMNDYEPLVILAIPNLDDEQAWFDATVQPIVDSMEFGEPAPAVEGGTARVSTFGSGVESAALELPPPGGSIEPGRYASDALGVPVELDLDAGRTAEWGLLNEEPGRLWINSKNSDQELLAMGRLGSWYDATEARTADITGLGSIPPDDIDGYIVQNDIIVVNSEEVEVGGRPAAFRQFRLDTTPGATGDFCDGSEPCLWASTGSPDVVGGTVNPLEVGFDRVQTMWLVDMGEFEPVYIFAVAHLGDEGDQQWIDDIVQPIVDSIEFGEPVPTVEGGTARIPERVAVTAEMSATQIGERDLENPWPVERFGSLDGDIVGTFTGTGVSSPNGADVTLDWTMDVTIEGLGTGTLTLVTYDFMNTDGFTIATDHVVGGTGDFVGMTGFGTTREHDDGDVYTATIELMLAPPTG